MTNDIYFKLRPEGREDKTTQSYRSWRTVGMSRMHLPYACSRDYAPLVFDGVRIFVAALNC